MTTLLALDPGGTTGWSLWHYDATKPLTLTAHGQVHGGFDGFVPWAYGCVDMVDEVVSESFRLDGRTMSPDVTPLRIEAAIEIIFGKFGKGVPVIWQPNTFKAHADDLFLKRHGFWFTGREHARDSARHALASMKVRRHGHTIAHYWRQNSTGVGTNPTQEGGVHEGSVWLRGVPGDESE